jgi:hypothetical protein
MDINDILQLLTNPQAWPLFLAFLGGYVMMNVFFERAKVKDLPELERILIAFGIGLLFEYFLFYPLVTLASFWWPSFSNNNVTFSAFLFCAVSGSALFLTIHNEPKLNIVGAVKRILIFSTIVLSAVVIFVSSIDVGEATGYQTYTMSLISGSWNAFTGLTIFSLVLFVIGAFFVWSYILKTAVNETLDIKFPAFEKLHISLMVAILFIPLLAGSIVVPMDTSAILFTPRMQTGAQVLSSIMQTQNGFYTVVFINATRGPENNVSAEYHYYALMNTTYNITLPTWRFLSSVYISNPSNTSFTMGQNYPYLPSASATDTWQLYAAAPENVTYNPILKQTPTFETRVTALVFDFGNFTGNSSLTLTLSYWQEIDPIDKVKIDYGNLTFTDLGNGTWTETHTIMITNNSNDTLIIDYDGFNFDYVIRNSTNVYVNGTSAIYSELVSLNRLATEVRVPPQTMSNVTMSFQTTRNPE